MDVCGVHAPHTSIFPEFKRSFMSKYKNIHDRRRMNPKIYWRLIMNEKHTKGEHHGCIVCGKLYELYSVYDANGKFIDCKVMSPGGKRVIDPRRPLVACEKHSDAEIEAAVLRVYGKPKADEEDE
jgi:hypothetical protein